MYSTLGSGGGPAEEGCAAAVVAASCRICVLLSPCVWGVVVPLALGVPPALALMGP